MNFERREEQSKVKSAYNCASLVEDEVLLRKDLWVILWFVLVLRILVNPCGN